VENHSILLEKCMLFWLPIVTMTTSHFFNSDSHKTRQKGFHPPSTFVTNMINETGGGIMTLSQANEFSTRFLSQKLQIPASDLKITNSYCQGDLCYFYFVHQLHGIDVTNHPAAVNLHKGNVVSYSHSFTSHSHIVDCEEIVELEKAVSAAQNELKMERKGNTKVQEIYYDTGNGIVPGYQMELENEDDYVTVVVSKCTSDLIHISSFINHDSL
jgi:hypothetical protein